MKNITLALCGVGMLATTVATHANITEDIYAQSYAVYMLYHPENKTPNIAEIQQNLTKDFGALFKQYKQPTQTDFVNYQQARLEPVLQQRREMSLKQSHVRFGILDANKDQKMTLKEFQASGMKTFDGMDKNADGIINAADAALAGDQIGTHDGFKVRLPISMPMANTHAEFVKQYGQGKDFTTLGDYLSARDVQFKNTDANQDHVVTEKEYVDEFMQRFDANLATGKESMKTLFVAEFNAIAKDKKYISAKDITNFGKQLSQSTNK